MTKKGRRRLTWLVVGVAVLGTVLWWWRAWRAKEVTVVSPTHGSVVETLAIIGRVAPRAEVHFAAREPTSIMRVPVEEGQHVEAGALLVHMDDAEASAMLAQAQAALAQAQAQTHQVRSVTSKTAAAALAEAKAQLEEAERTVARDEELFAEGMSTAAELDQSRTALTVARTRKRSAELAAAATSKNGAQWQGAVAAETFAEAGLVAARSRVERLSVRAPAAGVVTARHVEVGDVVQPGAALVTLVLDGPQKLVIEPDEKNLATLALGQHAEASVEAFPDDTFEAEIAYIAPAVDAARGTIEVRLTVPEPPPYLRTDMTVSVEIVVDERTDGLTVPSATIVDLATPSPFAWVVEEGRAVRRPVEIGQRSAARVEILSGLSRDDRVIATPDPDLEPGDRVTVVER